mmetsp:Transcript_18479/g.50884  ORF Transcript_18479/g.50884 Transcript_18479/m.50884 type:complete len:213 (-) Transcript_18479:2394-3032(-)
MQVRSNHPKCPSCHRGMGKPRSAPDGERAARRSSNKGARAQRRSQHVVDARGGALQRPSGAGEDAVTGAAPATRRGKRAAGSNGCRAPTRGHWLRDPSKVFLPGGVRVGPSVIGLVAFASSKASRRHPGVRMGAGLLCIRIFLIFRISFTFGQVGRRKLPREQLIPSEITEEWVLLDGIIALWPSTQTLGWIARQQSHEDLLCGFFAFDPLW